MSTIEETIARLRELDRVASPAPWASQRGHTVAGQSSLDIINAEKSFPPLMRLWADMTQSDRGVNPQNDFTLIIETRNALPGLLAEIRRLKAENAKAWDDGYKHGQLSGIRTGRTGHVQPYKKPYQENRK